tara:strand:+ start:1835 stop:2077 length:243 start_codon:yes stop_codon:yes gene_type:complete
MKKLSSIKTFLSNNPFGGVGTSIGGYFISLSDALSPFLRFLILFFSTITAISVAYIQYNKAWRIKDAKENASKKDRSNSR